MSKLMVCQTVICKVKGITLLNLNHENNENDIVFTDKKCDPKVVSPHQQMAEEDNSEDIVMVEEYDDEDNDEEVIIEENSYYEPAQVTLKGKIVTKKGIYEMEKVETSIESVRQYINTSRKNGKVWHQCRWGANRKNTQGCNYGSKWSGAMVNHIRSHLGVKPFRCLYCNKLFTIACNLKNHLRIHHGLKAKIILNGGRRVRQMSTPNKDVVQEDVRKVEEKIMSSDNSKLRIFKPSFVNGKATGQDTPYAERRTLPKRTVKKNQKYVDYEEDFEDDDEIRAEEIRKYNEEEAEEENRKFYAKTVEDEEDYADDDASRFVVKRRYNKKLWFVCVWNPRQCKYRSHVINEVITHVKKHQNIHQLICNWNHCSASFATQEQLDSHQLIHKRQKFFKCNYENCGFQTINETALKMHKIRHKKHQM